MKKAIMECGGLPPLCGGGLPPYLGRAFLSRRIPYLCATLFAVFFAHAQEPVAIKPGPDAGGRLPPSVKNEVDVAMDRGLKWLVAQQAEDGSFGETNKLLYTASVVELSRKKAKNTKKTEMSERALKWIVNQQAEDGGFGETNRMMHACMLGLFLAFNGMEEASTRLADWIDNNEEDEEEATMELKKINPQNCLDKSQINWREKLAAQHLSSQVVNGGVGYWRAQDVTVRVKKEDWHLWAAFWGVAEAVPRHETENGDFKEGKFPSDGAATIFVLSLLMDL